jgi:hypothetical protein
MRVIEMLHHVIVIAIPPIDMSRLNLPIEFMIQNGGVFLIIRSVVKLFSNFFSSALNVANF